ncbi:uncharacterized protein CTRU02_210169 [Colletotrichum truncatum]|uniref:Uncharacterized protein n=1 Tax=Colletotrichum truncatum TaxID=5467 RepID=A0ACC3YUG9_COLTU
MKETGKAFKKFVAQNIGTSIRHYIMTKKDKLLSSTYSMAYKMVFQPKDLPDDPEGRRMLQDLFQLWVAIRMESQSERIIGDETLGMDPQTLDEDVGSYGTVSITPMMSAQVELITTTQILLPLKAAVLKRLQQLIKANDPRSWFSIYLSLFILLHNCSILTADENKQAKKYGLQTRYVYDKFVEALHNGAKTMLYYFHYCNKGSSPFTPGWITPENLRMVQLNHSQERFIRESTEMIHQRLPEFRRIREAKDFENDWYFVSQLYDTRWGPTTTI